MAADSDMIELVLPGTQAYFNITETFSKGELTKSHAKKLIPAAKGFDLIVTFVAPDAAGKLLGMDEVRELGENRFSGIHPENLAGWLLQNPSKLSNRSHPPPLAQARKTLILFWIAASNVRMVLIGYWGGEMDFD